MRIMLVKFSFIEKFVISFIFLTKNSFKMLILKELLRISSQHRTLYCYLVLWIFLLIIFYVCTENGANLFNNKTFYTNNKIISDRNEERVRLKKHTEFFCNNVLNGLTEKNNDEGGFIENWSLQGN